MYQQDIRFYKTGHERLTDSTLAYIQQDIWFFLFQQDIFEHATGHTNL